MKEREYECLVCVYCGIRDLRERLADYSSMDYASTRLNRVKGDVIG